MNVRKLFKIFFLCQADSLEEAIDIVNRNKYVIILFSLNFQCFIATILISLRALLFGTDMETELLYSQHLELLLGNFRLKSRLGRYNNRL